MKVEKIKLQLDVDVIGDEGALTVAEEKALSDYFKQRKKKFPQIKIQKKNALKEVIMTQS